MACSRAEDVKLPYTPVARVKEKVWGKTHFYVYNLLTPLVRTTWYITHVCNIVNHWNLNRSFEMACFPLPANQHESVLIAPQYVYVIIVSNSITYFPLPSKMYRNSSSFFFARHFKGTKKINTSRSDCVTLWPREKFPSSSMPLNVFI